MFNATYLASLAMILTISGTPCVNKTPVCGQSTYASEELPSRGQIGYARAFVGGQEVIQITRADARRTPFMDVKASDLLISYVYDKKGNLVDRKVWYEARNSCAVCSANSIL